jgi:hypothetical protein
VSVVAKMVRDFYICGEEWSAPGPIAPAGHQGTALPTFLAGDLFAFFACLRQSDGNSLFSTLDFASLPAFSAFGFSSFVAMHFAFNV